MNAGHAISVCEIFAPHQFHQYLCLWKTVTYLGGAQFADGR